MQICVFCLTIFPMGNLEEIFCPLCEVGELMSHEEYFELFRTSFLINIAQTLGTADESSEQNH